MQRTLRPQPALAVLAAILAGLTLSLSAIAVAGGAEAPGAPANGCPPSC